MPITDRRLAPGTVLVAKHKGTEYRSEVVQGQEGKPRYRLADGREFKSPSAAGQAVTGTACNGWRFWSLAGAKADKATAAGASLPASGHTSPNVRRTGRAGPTAPTGRKAATTARTARKGAKPTRAAKAKGSKMVRKAPKRTAKAKKR